MIYVSRIVTVSKGLSLIDEQIVLYKGDKNVEVQFTLKNNPFKEKNGSTSTYATFGQLIINRDAGPIISEVSQMSNNRVVFIITGEMIDEFEEVGNYSFQIRLFNEDQSSRATLPPVKDGIAINEPICEEATVNTTYVNDSRSVVMPANNGIMLLAGDEDESDGLFDKEGNYNRTNWYSGDIITDVRLNRVEEALYQINDSVPLDYATEMYVDDSVRAIEESIEEAKYAKEDYVDNMIKVNIEQVEDVIDSSYIKKEDMNEYATKDHVAESIENIGLNDYATHEYVGDMINSNNSFIEDYVDSRYVTQDYFDDAMANIEVPGADLTGYATEEYVNNVLGDIEDLLGGI